MKGRRRLVLIGAGGYAREVAWLVDEANAIEPQFEIVAFVIDETYEPERVDYPYPVVRGLESYDFGHVEALCCVGSPVARRKIVERLSHRHVRWGTFIHPHGMIGRGSSVGEGSVVGRTAGCTVNVKIGRHAHINDLAGVGHDSRVGDYFTLSAFAEIAGRCTVGDQVFVGSHALVIPGTTVGDRVTVGAGSVVVKSVSAGATVFGNPAKLIH